MFCSKIASLRAVFLIAFACLAALVAPGVAGAVTVPAGFEQTTAISGLVDPMDVEVTPAGRVFVAEKSGIVKTFSSLSDPTPTVAADLRTEVHNFSARGLMSIAVDPNFPAQPYIYVYYTLDAKIGDTPPLYGDPDVTSDSCARANLGLGENCIVGGRISRLRIAGEVMTGNEQVLVEDWCQQYPVHTGGGLGFGADGYLYFTGGDGSTSTFWDYGQTGTPPNPCADPPGTFGSLLTPPTAEGGRLRVQDLRTPGDPTGLDGTLIRIDPRTGAGVPGNPLFNSPDANERRILAYGLRDSVRLAVRPGTNDVWVGDRGGGYWEEFDRVPDTSSVRNFGWPCYEGGMNAEGDPYTRVRPKSEEAGVTICQDLYAAGDQTVAPHWAYDHELDVVPGEPCAKDALGNSAGSLLSGMSFYPAAGGTFPAPYRKALFFGDRLRNCIYALLPGSDGLPERNNVVLFASDANRPMDLELTPAGDLLYVDQSADAIHSIKYVGNPANQAPTAVVTADKLTGPAPLTVRLDATKSTDPDARDAFSYEWDLDGDGAYDDSTNARPKFTLRRPGTATVAVRVTDTGGLTSTNSLGIEVTEPVTTLTFSPTEDARVEKNHPADNYGISDKLRGSLNEFESYLRFQVSGIGGEIRSAKLRLTAATNGTVDGPGVHSVSGDWSEAATTWATKPGHGADAASDTDAIAANAKVEWDVKSLINGDGQLDLALISTSTDSVEFLSKEASNATKRPVLEVTFATPFDGEAPTTPADLTADAAGSNINLAWTAATDNVAVTNYEIYRNGDLLTVTGNVTSFTDTTALVATPYEYTVKALDVNENRSDASNAASATVPDTQNPTEPQSLQATASAGQVALDWDAASDNIGVTGYRVYRGEDQIASVDGDTTSHTETGLPAGPHSFTVRAIDAAGNLSDASSVATATVPDTDKPSAPSNLDGAGSPGQVALTWDASTDNVDVTGYRVYRNGTQVGSVLGNVTSFTHTGLTAGQHSYTVRAVDAAGNLSDVSNTATATVPDSTKPSVPGNLRATASAGQVALLWNASTDNVGVTGYKVYRAGSEVASLGVVTSYTETSLPAGSHSYTVRAFDAAGNLSDASNIATAAVPDTVKPTAPSSLSGVTGPGQVVLNWTGSTDNVGVTGYRVYRDGTQVGTTLGGITTFTHTNLQSGNSDYTVRAVDAAGNLSDASNTATVNIPDAQKPSAPWFLRATAGTGQVVLRWNSSTDNVAVSGYRIYRGATQVGIVDGATLIYTDTNVVGSLSYTVRAFDGAGNLSDPSNTATATVADSVKPSTPSSLTATATPGQVALSWAGSTDNVGVTSYRIYRNGTQVGSVLGAITTFAHTGLTAGTFGYTVRAVDAAGNLSDASNTATVTVPDSIAPSAPRQLRATVGTGQVVLTWKASTDNVGVTGYRIYQSGAQIGSVAGNILTYTHTGVAGPLSYTVRAIDAAGNLSDPSNTRSLTVPDSIKPTIPGSPTATPGTGQIVLSWTASTDNAGVTGYRVYRSGTQVGSVNGTTLTYTHTGLAPGAYSYTVRAIDATGNLSDPSNTATATLADTQAPTAPANLAGSAASATRVNLSWTASTDNVGVSTYEIYRNGLLLAGPGNVTSFADTTTVASTAYQYTVKAVDAAGNRSNASNTVNVTTPAAGPVTPTTRSFSAVADARVQEANPTTNYGTANSLRTVAGSSLDVESYLKFDLAGITGPVKTAVLRLAPLALSWDGPGVRSAASNWTETGVTWSNRPVRGATAVADKGILWQTVDYDVKSLVTGNGTVSFALLSTSAYATDFGSREQTDPTKRPQLIITY